MRPALAILAAGNLLALAMPAQAAGDMMAATFLAKAEALLAKGPMALFSSDVGLLKREAAAARSAYLGQLRAERVRGAPSSCPPDRVDISQSMMMAQLRSYTPAQRTATPMRTVMADLYKRNWPCR